MRKIRLLALALLTLPLLALLSPGSARAARVQQEAPAVSTILYSGSLCLTGEPSDPYCMGNKNGTLAQGNPTIMWEWFYGGHPIDFAEVKTGTVSICYPWPCGDNLNTVYSGQNVYLFEYYPGGSLSGWCTIANGINTDNYLYQCDDTKTNQLWVDGYQQKTVAVYNSYRGEFNGTVYYLSTSCKDCDGTPVSTAANGTAYVNWFWNQLR